MACVCVQRTLLSRVSLWQSNARNVTSSQNAQVLQVRTIAVSSSLQLRLLNSRQRISITCTSSWKHEIQKRSRWAKFRCESSCSQGASSSEDSAGYCVADDESALPPLQSSLLPVVYLTRAVALLRERFQQWRMKFQSIGQGAELEVSDRALLRQGGLGMALLSTSMIARDRISPVLLTLRENPTFMSGLVAWAIAQVMKVFTTYFVERRWDWKMLVGSGGMPSSHSALCVGLTTAVALCHGVSDSLFPVCLGFSLIVMYDAAGVRRHAGRQAEVLNMIVEDLFQGHPISEKKLKELLGHTPLQVGAGAFLGVVCGYLCSHASMVY